MRAQRRSLSPRQTLPIATRQLNNTTPLIHRRLTQTTTRTLVITANASLTLTVTDTTAGTTTAVATGTPLVLTGNRAYVVTYPNNVPYVPTFTYAGSKTSPRRTRLHPAGTPSQAGCRELVGSAWNYASQQLSWLPFAPPTRTIVPCLHHKIGFGTYSLVVFLS